ncbi:hypothetical protein [Halostagnicola sp. A-GB9-2]|uniref:hypothetical protein n=1 Tax=Halostagnicola sp. A-GB9-2 TaxID=3048066 RepID=UPI0024C0740E|nr:hypothetical protein [Halostagnicola sp. A-GB9-2]MDJ1431201.1 hypothetical protein [Halostagnicola sp. A-GB9-2]
MDVDLVALGILAIAVALGVGYAVRFLYPRLDAPEESLTSLQFLTALIVGILLALGIGLILVGVLV